MAGRNTYFQDEIVSRRIDLRQLIRIFAYIKPYRGIFLFVIFLMLASSTLSMFTPILLKRIIDVAVPEQSYRMLWLSVAGMTALAAMEIAVTWFHQRYMGMIGHEAIATIRQDAFYKLQRLPFDYFDSRPNGKIVVRVTDYVNDLANFFTNTLVMLVIYLVKIVVATIFMLSLSRILTGVVFAAVIPMIIIVMVLRYIVRKLFTLLRAKNSNRAAFIVESIMGEKVIKNYNRTAESQEIYAKIHDDSLRVWLSIVRRSELNSPTVMSFWNLGTLMLYGLSLSMILSGNALIGAGTVVAFTNYMTQFSGPLTQIAMIIQQLSQVSSNLEQVFDLIEQPVEIDDQEGSIELKDVKGRVDYSDVCFAYDKGVNILEHFDLHVEPGETIALVGPTGAGKTTVINLLTRFYDVDRGSVSIDGIDVRRATLESLRREVGVLMQDPFIFKGSVLENIRYGRPDATDAECRKAAERIHVDHFIKRLPGGYAEELSERGTGLSAGERQLLSFARIILKDPSVIILDEATSAIDTETESLIQQALEEILKGRTAFMVAHRLSTIRGADRILYISDGGIAEEGTHEELMALHGKYYELNRVAAQEQVVESSSDSESERGTGAKDKTGSKQEGSR